MPELPKDLSPTRQARNTALEDSRRTMPQLDSLRAIAFCGVAASHWLREEFPLASVGGTLVQLFFVLSGFLITGILLDYRRSHEDTAGLTAASALRTFYARRFLRIFPLFYATIVGAVILDVGPVRDLWFWHAAYASNFLYAIQGAAPSDPFTHFWTLAVEEQFYLVWPFLVFFVRLNALKGLILALVVIAPAFRIGMDIAFPALHRVNYLPPSCGDALGIGAYLALASRHPALFAKPVSTVARRMLGLGIAGGITVAGLMLMHGASLSLHSLGHTFFVLACGWLVFGATRGFVGPIGVVLNRPELQFLGRISYGLYVFHHFFTFLDFPHLFARLGLPAQGGDSALLHVLLRSAFTVSLAVVSWFAFEKPLNDLKRHFTLRKKLQPTG